jgi:hypothetical protein
MPIVSAQQLFVNGVVPLAANVIRAAHLPARAEMKDQAQKQAEWNNP